MSLSFRDNFFLKSTYYIIMRKVLLSSGYQFLKVEGERGLFQNLNLDLRQQKKSKLVVKICIRLLN